MELCETVRAHDPHEPHAGESQSEMRQRCRSEGRAEILLEVRDYHAGIVHHLARKRHALVQRLQLRPPFQGIPGCHNPPHTVERQPLQGDLRNQPVRGVRRIERAPQQADPLARLGMGRSGVDGAEAERGGFAHALI